MYRISSNFGFHTVAAGEPMALQVQLQDANGDALDIADEGMVLSVYNGSTREIVDQEEGERSVDLNGDEFFSWLLNGVRTETLYGQQDLRLEVARRLQHGRDILATGTLLVSTSALTVPTLDSEDEAETAQFVVIRANAVVGGPVRYIVTTVALNVPTPPAYQIPIGALVATLL